MSDGAQPVGGEVARLQEVIKELLNRHAYLHEKRIQKLVFLADLHSIQTRGKRLVEADYKPYYYGVYSDLVSVALQTLADVKVAVQQTVEGSETLVFYKSDKPFKTQLTPDDRRVIDEVMRTYATLSNEELAQIGKHTLLWESAEHGQPFDYESYLKDPLSRTPPAMVRAFEAAQKHAATGGLRVAKSVDELLDPLFTE